MTDIKEKCGIGNETNIHSIHYWIRITKLHNEWNGMDICLTNNHLPDFSFITLTRSESETNVELHPKLQLTNILIFKQHYSFITILLHIPVCALVEITCQLMLLITGCCCWFHYIALFNQVTACNCLWLNYLTLCEGLGLEVQVSWSWNKSLGLGLAKKSLIYISAINAHIYLLLLMHTFIELN